MLDDKAMNNIVFRPIDDAKIKRARILSLISAFFVFVGLISFFIFSGEYAQYAIIPFSIFIIIQISLAYLLQCPSCQKRVNHSDHYCSKCGNKLSADIHIV
jgi:hypothetical protein